MERFSPLRYPGGKARLSSYISKLIEYNDICDAVYVEPFAGGASVALSLLFNETVSRILINDLDLSIYALWYAIVNYPEEICKLIRDTPVDIVNWDKQRNIQRDRANVELFLLGFSTLFLNRTNRSGILTGGIIGGRGQCGAWKIDARFNKQSIIEKIYRIARYNDRIIASNLDCVDLLEKQVELDTRATFIYFDPPYYQKGQALYLNSLKHDDHVRINSVVAEIKNAKWVMSYDNNDIIKKLYNTFAQSEYSLMYYAQNVRVEREVMIYSRNCLHPTIIL